jgi:glycosyltransferase involved in cell wall biosynthesis
LEILGKKLEFWQFGGDERVRHVNPQVSIITPTYNHESFIAQAIESVLAQSYENWEQIVIDDGSTDQTAEIIKRYCDPRIRYIYQEHQGRFRLADTYNKAFSYASGDLIAILEGDDFWPPDKLAILIPAFDDPDVVLAYGVTQVVNSFGVPVPQTIPSHEQLRRYFFKVFNNEPIGAAVVALAKPGQFVFPVSAIIRCKALQAIGGFLAPVDRHAVDFATFLNLTLIGKFAFIPRIAGYWRRHEGSTALSSQIEQFMRSDFQYSMEFIGRYGDRVGLSAVDHLSIKRAWNQVWPNIHLGRGRVYLAQRKWAEARFHFLQALKFAASPRHIVIPSVGYILSWFHRDLEPFYKLFGKSDIRDVLGLR